MTDDARSATEEPATVPLRATRGCAIDIALASEALTDLAWLGPRVDGPADRSDLRRFGVDLELPILDGSAAGPIRKAALLDFGIPRAVVGGVLVDVGWRSASLAPLFPVFAGQLRVTATSLALVGAYVPPFGRLGLLMDAGVLHLAARRTAQAFLARLARHFEARD